MFWGNSEALDLVDEYLKHIHPDQAAAPDEPIELNILLYGPNDPRHILKTIAKCQADNVYTNIKVHFYVLEGCVELLCRHLLLLNVALEPAAELSLKAKTHIFMDLYGNALLRPASHNYLCSKARIYMDVITDLDGVAKEKVPLIRFDQLKYGERDAMSAVFSFWQNRPHNVFDIARYWECRVRAYLETRYDSRMGAFDWDLSMRLRDNGVERVCAQEYKHWRDCGVAFVFPEFEQTLPNKTLAAAVQSHGDGFRHRGYVGDITAGPFVTFGEKCPDAKMCESAHGTNTYRATDITERNVFALMFEIVERQPYQHDLKHSRQFGASSMVLSKHMAADPALMDDRDDVRRYDAPMLAVANVSVTFLPMEDVLRVGDREKFHRFFDVVFVSQNYYAFVKENLRDLLAAKALVLFETKQYQILRTNALSEFLDKVKTFAAGALGLRAITHFHINLPLPIVRYTNVQADRQTDDVEKIDN